MWHICKNLTAKQICQQKYEYRARTYATPALKISWSRIAKKILDLYQDNLLSQVNAIKNSLPEFTKNREQSVSEFKKLLQRIAVHEDDLSKRAHQSTLMTNKNVLQSNVK